MISVRKMVFRSVFLLFFGLVAVGVLLDRLVLNATTESEWSPEQQWLTANFELLELRLNAADMGDTASVVEHFATQFNLRVELLDVDDMVMPNDVQLALQHGEVVQLFSPEGEAQYFRLLSLSHLSQPEQQKTLASLAGRYPAPESTSSWWWISSVYYALVLGLLVWWLLPLVRDIQRLNNSAHRLGKDINARTPELGEVTELTELSATFAKMAAQIKAMVHGQKEMTNALSHELRTPLARVKFGIAVLQSKVDAQVCDELHKINDDINEFDDLIGRMLDYSRLDDPALHFQPQYIEVRPWLEQLCEKSRASERGVQYQLNIEPGAEMVYADSTLLSLAFSNLFSNALRYAESTIAVRCFAHNEGAQSHWTMSVQDDGAGIPEHKLRNVFKAFTRLDESRDRGTGGHGLGLAVVARIAALHNGHCRASRSPLGGAQFDVVVIKPQLLT